MTHGKTPPRNLSQGYRPFIWLSRKASIPQAKIAKAIPSEAPNQIPKMCLECRISGRIADEVSNEYI
jgi:hypothetical protein